VSTILNFLLTILFIMPFVGFFLVFFMSKIWTKDHKKSFHIAIDYTTILFIISVYFLMNTIWGKSFIWLILLVMIMIAIVFVIVHWRIKEEIILTKVTKGIWRFNFLLFTIAYITLTLYGLILRVLTFTFS
jgi:Protein of unknown function (DUF3397)